MPAPLDVFIVAGQSNASGRGDADTSPAVTGDSIMWTDVATDWAPLDDPLYVDANNRGSAWPAFVNAYETASTVACGIIMTAEPGTSLIDGSWQASTYGIAINRVEDAIAALDTDVWTPTIRGVLWHQGENEGQNYTPVETLADDYEAALIDLVDRFGVSLGQSVPVFVFRLGRLNSGDTAGFIAVRAGQDAAALADSRVVMTYENCVNFPGLGWMSDSLHYTQDGYDDMGTVGGALVADFVYQPSTTAAVTLGGATAAVALGGSTAAVGVA